MGVRALSFFYLYFTLVPLVCVCCHSIVDLGVCLCDRVASLWNGGGVMVCVVSYLVLSVFSSSSSSLLVVFGVVRAQPCEHARYPRTPLCSLLSLLSFCVPRLSSAFRLSYSVEWRCVIHHVSECSVGMTAMGSLSLSFSFFW